MRKARERAHLTQQELAGLAGVSILPLHHIENGKGNPRIQTVLAILQALGLTLTTESLGTHRAD
ncbi:MAG: helix-turn-helix domain-containing protein [bacterium]